MDIKDFNNKIVIIKDNFKNDLLKLLSNTLLNVKIITLNELKKNYYFDYDEESIYYVSDKYNVNYDIAKTYIKNLYYLKDIDSEKVKLLNNIKEDLDNMGLLKYNKLFRSFLSGKSVLLIDLDYVDDFYNNIFNDLKSICNVEKYNINFINSKKELYECKSIEEEIEFVGSKICELIKSGVDINNIKLTNVKDNYIYPIKKTFRLLGIPVNLEDSVSINGSILVKKFKELYSSNIDEVVNSLKEYVITDKDNKVFKSIIDIVNKYSFIDDYLKVKDFIFEDIKNTKVRGNELKNAVKLVDIENDIISDLDYVFLINYNEGVIPVNYKDEDYLSDEVKSKLGISTSSDLNYKANLNIKNNILRCKNLIVTYSKHDIKGELFISSSFDNDIFEKKEACINYNNSNMFNKIKLISDKDNYNKYGSITDRLVLLNNTYNNEEYNTYSNKYDLINRDSLNEYLNNKLSISYTKLNTYNLCAFKYYLEYILKINKYEDSFDMNVGNIFHKVLSECFKDNYDFETGWNNAVRECKYEFSTSDKFFLSILKDELVKVIEVIKNQLNYTQLHKFMYEKEINIDINPDLHIKFEGKIDKVMYEEFNGQILAVIVDYKTGNTDIKEKNWVYGIDMQLPIYLYLIKNEIKNVRIGGFYLQKIISNEKDETKKLKDYKLMGYSNSDYEILEKVDSSYMDSNIIRSLKVGNNGFYHYSKMISDEEIEILYKMVDKKIKETSENIINANFDINPKQIKKDNRGCKYCKYNDICYVRNEDIVTLKEVNDMFGGEIDD